MINFTLLSIFALILVEMRKNSVCGVIKNINIYHIILMIILVIIVTTFLSKESSEGFVGNVMDNSPLTVVFGDRKVDLDDYFNFIESTQVDDLDTNTTYHQIDRCRDLQYQKVIENIRNTLDMLHFIVNNNDGDNFYHRFLIICSGADLNQDGKRRVNYEELVENKIGNQIGLNEGRLEVLNFRPSHQSMHQGYIPHTRNVHNYYNYKNTEVNLLVLKRLLETHWEDYYNKIVRPSETGIFEYQFLMPIDSIRNSIKFIIRTDMYKEYVQRFRYKQMYPHPQLFKNTIW